MGPMLFPGEHFEARVSRGILTIAELSLDVDEPCLQEGVEVFQATSRIERSGVVGAAKPGRIDSQAWLYRASGLPRSVRSVGTTPKRTIDLATIFGTHQYHSYYRSTRHSSDKPPFTRQKTRPLPPDELTYDGHTALGALRSWATTSGRQGTLNVLLGRKLWQLELQVRKQETVTVGGEEHEAIPIVGTARRLTMKLTPMSQVRRWSIWFSADDRRLPLKAEVEHRKGPIELELVSYDFEPPVAERMEHCEPRGASPQ